MAKRQLNAISETGEEFMERGCWRYFDRFARMVVQRFNFLAATL